jgi:predicted regulator of Ras-like GTPase activity (Roadblock/LC7/MglB family)
MESNIYLEKEIIEEGGFERNLEALLNMFLLKNQDVRAAAIITTEGLPIISTFPAYMNEGQIAATTATLLSLAQRSISEMEGGKFHELFIKGKEGYLILLKLGVNAVLMVSTTLDAQLGLLFFEGEQICEKITNLL